MYDPLKVAEFWGRRLAETDEFSAVLSFGAPHWVNKAYTCWESELILSSLFDVSKKYILDVACGIGRLTIPLAQKGAKVIGIDISSRMLNRCKSNLVAQGLKGKAQLIQANSCNIPLPARFFDIVLCAGILEHLPPTEQEKLLKESARVLKPQGNLFAVVNNDQSLFLRLTRHYRMSKLAQNGYFCNLIHKQQIKKLLEQNNFKVEVIGENLFYSLCKHGIIVSLSTRLMTKIFTLAARADLKWKKKGDGAGFLVDHYLLKATKR